jgi:hypothetical protein
MFCLLCHEKISRLRAWRTKSEFCCDEHAEIYKRQTLERLLTDHEHGKPGEAPPLPVETSASPAAGAAAEKPTAASEALARFEEIDNARAARRPSKPEAGQDAGDDEGLQELWRLAEEVSPASGGSDDDWSSAGTLSEGSSPLEPGRSGNLGSGLGTGLGVSLGGLGQGVGRGGGVRRQSPEEALAALRQLSGKPRRPAAGTEEGGDELDTLLSARGPQVTEEEEDGLDLSAISDLPSSFDESLAGEEAWPALDAASLEPLSDDELPSMFERLTETSAAAEDLDLAAAPEAEELAAEPPPAVEAEEPVHAAREQRAEPTAGQQAPSEDADEEIAAAQTDLEKLEALDLIEKAVESHLEQAEPEREQARPKESEEPAGRQGVSHKVVPFPLLRPKKASREPEGPRTDAGRPAAASDSGERALAKSAKTKSAKGMAADLSRLQLRPVAVMFGLEPSLQGSAGDAGEGLAALETQPGIDRLAEPPICYPDAGGGRRAGARLPLHARLFPLLPETPEPDPFEGDAGRAAGPDYSVPLETPPPLAMRQSGKPGVPSVGSERAWMFQIEPALADGCEFEPPLPNGNGDTRWQSLQLPPALMAAVQHSHGGGKLDLSGRSGGFEPPVDRLCLVYPQLGELGAGVSRQSSSKTPGEELGRWMPPMVLDPRFDIERPAGRDLSDFG